jgi:hypothetical protein
MAVASLGVRISRAVVLAPSAAVFLLCWLVKYNEPEGNYGGLIDDHLHYAIRGWQILFGEFPTLDFVDHGAPLTFFLTAAARWLIGPGVWGEALLTSVALALGVAITSRLAARASGSTLLGIAAAIFQIMLGLRLYNYPKIIVYAIAIQVLWAFADRPGWRTRLVLAIVTAVSFLIRHDHGIYIGVGLLVLLVLHDGLSWRERVRHATIYGATVAGLLAPYVVFLQVNEGVVRHFVTAAAWAARERERSSFSWPSFSLQAQTDSQWPLEWMYQATLANLEPLLFYSLLAWPVVVLAALVFSRVADREAWPHARSKLGAVAVLAIVMNSGFLRSPLGARLGDVSVPQAILLAWLLAATIRAARESFTTEWRGWWTSSMARTRAVVVAVALMWVPGVLISGLPALLEETYLLGGVEVAVERVRSTTRRYQRTFPLENWARPDEKGPMRLAFYLRDCTMPTDHVFVPEFLPMVATMAQRPFAGGLPTLRAGFFSTVADQELAIERFEAQSMPIAILPGGEIHGPFSESFPLLMAYFGQRYESLGDRDMGDGLVLEILIERDAKPTGTYTLLDAPCFGG